LKWIGKSSNNAFTVSYILTLIQMYQSILRAIVAILIFLSASLAYGQSFEMFGINILSATRSQIADAILQRGAEKLPHNDPLTDRYDASAIFSGARMFVEFIDDEELGSIVCQFDSGSLFVEVMKFDALKSTLIEKYGQPTVTPAENRHGDFEEELLLPFSLLTACGS